MFKRGLSLAIVAVMVSTLGFASFGDVVKKQVSDEDIKNAIKIESPSAIAVTSEKSDNVTISGTVTTPQGISVTISLSRLDGKELIESANAMKLSSIPDVITKKDYESDRERNIVKKLEKAYDVRKTAYSAFNKAQEAYDKSKKDVKVKEELEKAKKNWDEADKDYREAASSYLNMTTVYIFEDENISGKFSAFNRSFKGQSGFYKLIFKRLDTSSVVKEYEFQVDPNVKQIEELINTLPTK